jgi:hypothetical protein
MKKSLVIWLIAGGILLFMGIGIFGSVVSLGNQEIELKNQFKQKMDERTAFYDKMWKTLAQKSQIALRNDSSFSRNVNAIMTGRKDAEGIFMKWVQESNPNANYSEVSKLYADLSRAVEGQRDGFFNFFTLNFIQYDDILIIINSYHWSHHHLVVVPT